MTWVLEKMQLNLLPSHRIEEFFSSSEGSPLDSLEENPFLFPANAICNRNNKGTIKNYIRTQPPPPLVPYNPPSCPFGAIGPPSSKPKPVQEQTKKFAHIEFLENIQNIPPQYTKQSNLNTKAPSKPWKEMIDVSYESFFSDYDFVNSYNTDDFMFLNTSDEFQLKFNQPSPVGRVKNYKKFRDNFDKSSQRSSTPVHQLVVDFEKKCSLKSLMTSKAIPQKRKDEKCSKENKKPKKRTNESNGKSVTKIENSGGCTYCWKSGRHELIATSHTLKDSKKRVLCPYLRVQVCRLCKADGDIAHEYEDCPAHFNMENFFNNQKIGSNFKQRRLNFC